MWTTALNSCFLTIFVSYQLPRTSATSNARRENCMGKIDMDACRNMTEIIAAKGYPVQVHRVVTKDSYVLKVIRIPHGRTHHNTNPRPVVFLLHSLLASSTDYVINMPHQSLGYILADTGYDVWMGNVRGNTYTTHLKLSRRSRMFWDFSLDEIASRDVPSMIDYVLNMTKQENLFYVGHSQGSMALFGLLSERPDYSKKIRLFCALGPVTNITHIISPIRMLAPLANGFKQLFAIFGIYDFMSSNDLLKSLARTICNAKLTRVFCEGTIFTIAGMSGRTFNKTRLPVLLSHLPAGTSMKNLVHFAQIILQQRFQKFDNGPSKNRLLYGQDKPPEYNLSRVMAPVAIFWSLNDWLAHPDDIKTLVRRLPNVALDYQVPDPLFSHLDFSVGTTARSQVYDKMIEIMDSYRHGTTNGA